MKKNCTILFVFILTVFTLSAQAPKREMRATWIATVEEIDWPRVAGVTEQKNRMIQILDSVRGLNMNAVFFQVRSRCDAMYNSAYEPWSSDLRVSRGTNPGYDPLAFAIEECHKRGIECHAWLNPYRYSRTGNGWTGANNHPLNYENTRPDWLLWYSNNVVCNPALSEVRTRIKSIVGDILSKYDVDGIIFDDYFYPYGGTTTQDAASVEKYKPANMNVHDWRRDNVNRMIADVYDTIQTVRPSVTFGVSPFGIWTTDTQVAAKEGISLPSGISGGNMYQEIYCDPVAWLKEGTVDYISPQLYWKTGGGQDYNTLCPWWANLANRFGVHFYSSMANYKYNEKSDPAYTIEELASQSLRNRTSSKDDAPGSVFYNTLAWFNPASPSAHRDFRNYFRANVFTKPSLTPTIGWKPSVVQGMVTFNTYEGSAVSWEYDDTNNAVRYAVYAVPIARSNDPSVYSKPEYLLGVSYAKQYTLPAGISTSSHRIAVSVLDRYGNEFSPRVLGIPAITGAVKAQLTYPVDNSYSRVPLTFKWNAVDKADSYIWQLATDANFTDIVCARETTSNQFDTSSQLNIREDDRIYFWRVRTRKANTPDIWSETGKVILSNRTGLDAIAAIPLKAYIHNNNLTVETVVAGMAVVRVYNLLGQLLSTSEHYMESGRNIIPFNNSYSGISLINIQMGNDVITIKK